MEQNRSLLFRQAALDRLSAPEELEERLQVVPTRAWLALVAAAGLVLSAVAWGIFGRIPVTVMAEGVFVSAHDAVVLVSPAEARRLQPGMLVSLQVQVAGADLDAANATGSVRQIDPEIAGRERLLELLATEARLPSTPRIAVTIGFRSTVPHLRGESCPVRIVVGERRPFTVLFGP